MASPSINPRDRFPCLHLIFGPPAINSQKIKKQLITAWYYRYLGHVSVFTIVEMKPRQHILNASRSRGHNLLDIGIGQVDDQDLPALWHDLQVADKSAPEVPQSESRGGRNLGS